VEGHSHGRAALAKKERQQARATTAVKEGDAGSEGHVDHGTLQSLTFEET